MVMSTESTEMVTDGSPRAEAVTEGSPRATVGKRPTGRRHFSMSVVNFWLDAALLALLTLYGWVTAMMRIVFPAPTIAKGWSLWGWTFDQWWDFQFGVLCAFAIGVVIHVMFHWNWVCSVVMAQILKSKDRTPESMQTIYGVVLLIALLHVIAIGVIAALYSVQHVPH